MAAIGVIDLSDGLFHFTSSGSPDQGLKLRTPVATIGIRGTEFVAHVDGDGATVIDILDGTIDAIPHGSSKAVTCIGSQSILVSDEVTLVRSQLPLHPRVDPSHDRDAAHGGQDGERVDRKELPAKDPPRNDPPSDPEPPGCSTC